MEKLYKKTNDEANQKFAEKIVEEMAKKAKKNNERFEYSWDFIGRNGPTRIPGIAHIEICEKDGGVSDTLETGGEDYIKKLEKATNDAMSKVNKKSGAFLEKRHDALEAIKKDKKLRKIAGIKEDKPQMPTSIRGLLICYVGVKHLPPYKVDSFIKKMKYQFLKDINNWKLPKDIGITFIPQQTEETYVEFINFDCCDKSEKEVAYNFIEDNESSINNEFPSEEIEIEIDKEDN